jgi:hypothetical protein
MDGNHKGETGDYYRIIGRHEDYIKDTTEVVLGLYPSKTVAKAESNKLKNLLGSTTGVIIEGTFLTLEDMYKGVHGVQGWEEVGDDI